MLDDYLSDAMIENPATTMVCGMYQQLGNAVPVKRGVDSAGPLKNRHKKIDTLLIS